MTDEKSVESEKSEKGENGMGGSPPLESLKVPALQQLCRARNLCRTGDKRTLLNRLLAHDRPGRAGRFTGGGAVKCRVCGAPARVTGTKIQSLDGGKKVRIRFVRCEGKKVHKDKLVEDA
jgi:hypothetical protein